MNRLIVPEIFAGKVTAFFTGKDPGADPVVIGRMLGIPADHIYIPVQKHTDKILVIESSLEPKIGDAVVTREKGIMIGVQVADCVPVLIHERSKGIMGAVHAGWRGTAAGILKSTIRLLLDRFNCTPSDMYIAIGPAIRQCCYGVDADVLHQVRRTSGGGEYFTRQGEKYCLDLPSANLHQALSLGVPGANIWVSGDCTFCSPERFYSYRYAKGPTGRQGGFIGLF